MLRTLVRSVLVAGVAGPVVGTVLILPLLDRPAGNGLSTLPEVAVAGVMIIGPVAALGGLFAGVLAITLARYPAHTRTRGTWVGRAASVGVASGAAAILVAAALFGAWNSGVVWAGAGLAAVSGGPVGALVGFLTWPDVNGQVSRPETSPL